MILRVGCISYTKCQIIENKCNTTHFNFSNNKHVTAVGRCNSQNTDSHYGFFTICIRLQYQN